MKRSALTVLTMAFLATATFLASAAAGGSSDLENQRGVAALRAATARYHDLDATLASGRVDVHACLDHMGQHYADPATFGDGILDPLDPEAMVYADDGTGHLRLVAVEWISTTPGTVMGMPLHFNDAFQVWIHHAWIWSPNPDGMFADHNPRIGNCP